MKKTLGVHYNSIFDAASTQARQITGLDYGFIIAALFILLLVIGLTLYITIRYRFRKNAQEPKQTTGNRNLEMLMVGIPSLLVIVFFFWSLKTKKFLLFF